MCREIENCIVDDCIVKHNENYVVAYQKSPVVENRENRENYVVAYHKNRLVEYHENHVVE